MPVIPDPPLADFRAMLDVFNKAEVGTLDIMGGEPTLHPEIVQLIHEAVAAGLSVNVSSNGSNLSVLRDIIRIGEAVTVGISVNDQKTFEQVRGFILAHRPIVKSVFSPSMDTDLIRNILSLNPKRYYFIYRDALQRHELPATVPFPRFLQAVEQGYDPVQVGMVSCSGFLPDAANHPELAGVRCPAGTTKLGVLPDGSVYPCNLFFGKKEFLLGNILTDSFEGIWNHQALAFFRSAPGNVCPEKSCMHHKQCHGGCPAQALVLAGDLSAPDPRCSPVTAMRF
jgi:radical SAM protein with 4Fe4S-binding SPASM domain